MERLPGEERDPATLTVLEPFGASAIPAASHTVSLSLQERARCWLVTTISVAYSPQRTSPFSVAVGSPTPKMTGLGGGV